MTVDAACALTAKGRARVERRNRRLIKKVIRQAERWIRRAAGRGESSASVSESFLPEGIAAEVAEHFRGLGYTVWIGGFGSVYCRWGKRGES